MRYARLALLLFLSGCAGTAHVGDLSRTFEESRATQADAIEEIKSLKKEAQQSNKAITQAITGIGANLGSLVDQVKVVGAEVGQVETRLEAKLNVHAEVQAKATAQIVAKVDTRLEALANAQVGLKNEVSQEIKRIAAGRDAITNSVEFSTEQMKTAIAATKAQAHSFYVGMGTLAICFLFVVWMQERSRQRAINRAEAAYQAKLGKQNASKQ